MADNATPTGATPAAPAPVAVTPPTAPVVETPAPARLSVPASAIFDKEDLTLPGATPAAPAKTEPAAPAAPAKTEPAAPAAAEPAAPAKTEPAAPAAPEPKVKVGGKEYTIAELEKAMADRNQPAAPAPAPAPAPAAPAPKQPTPEEVQKMESTWMTNFVNDTKLSIPFSKEDVETILTGGEDAAKLFSQKLTDAVARTVMMTRQSIYNDLNPILAKIDQTMQPMVSQQEQLERVTIEQAFLQRDPDFIPHVETARQVAQLLVEQYPQQVAAMTRDQFIAEVAKQTDQYLQNEFKRWNPASTQTWREAAKASATPPAAPVAAAPAAPAAPAAAPAPVKPATPPAPAGNSPGSVVGTPSTNWHKSVAQDLQG